MNDSTVIIIAVVLITSILFACVVANYPTLITVPFAFVCRLFRRHPSYYRPPLYNPADLEVHSLSDGPSAPALANESTTLHFRTNDIRRIFDLPPTAFSLSGTRYTPHSFSAALVLWDKHIDRLIIRAPGRDDAALPTYQALQHIYQTTWEWKVQLSSEETSAIPQWPQPARLRDSFDSVMDFRMGSLLDLPLMDKDVDVQPHEDTASEILPSDTESATSVSEATTLVDGNLVVVEERED